MSKKPVSPARFTVFTQFLSKHLLWLTVVVFLLNLVVKSWWVTAIPPLITHDEMYYANEAQTLVLSGSDVTGKWHPWQLAPANPIYSELTGVTLVPGFLLFPNDHIAALKTMPLLLGSLLPILLAAIVLQLTHSKRAYLMTMLVASLNPWIFQFSRMSFDSLFSISFYCLGIMVLLSFPKWWKLIAVAPLTWGFYQYQGHKPLLLPLIVVFASYLLWHLYKTTNKQLLPALKTIARGGLPLLLIVGWCTVLTGWYAWRLPQISSANRITEVLTANSDSIAAQVNENRRLTLPNPFLQLADNKYTVYTKKVVEQAIATFDVSWLFLRGDGHVDSYAATEFGFFHILDIGLLLVAAVWLWSTPLQGNQKWLWSALLLIGLLPNALKAEQLWLTFRGSWLIMVLVMLTGIGATIATRLVSTRTLLVGVSIYLLATVPFFYYYFFRYPISTMSGMFFYDRVVASYIQRHPQRQMLIFAQQPKLLFDQLLTYNRMITPGNLDAIHLAYNSDHYTVGNITITNDCIDTATMNDQSKIVIADYRVGVCDDEDPALLRKTNIQVGSVIDSGARYRIYHDTSCDPTKFDLFVPVNRKLLRVETLNTPEFCQTFFLAR